MKYYSIVLWTLITTILQAQIVDVNEFAAHKIPPDLLKNAHAVVRLYDQSIEVLNMGEATTTEHKVITLLDEKATKYSEPVFEYSKIVQIDDIEANVYDTEGKLIRKMKKKDIFDFKPLDNGVDDNRFKTITFPRLKFPYTIEYKIVYHHKGLLHYPAWVPQENAHESVEKAFFHIQKPSDVHLKFKELNLPKKGTQNGNTYTWSLEKLKAFVGDYYIPSTTGLFPMVLTSPNEFSIEGFTGKMDSWLNFGKFQNELNEGRMELPTNVVSDLKKLVADCPDDYCKIEHIYQKLQNTTRYFSIQLGIGGWQTIPATDVDRRKYGDCKALSNYMLAMLNAVGIAGHYVLIMAGPDNQVQYPDFPNALFNHAIACVPMKNDTVWLECTSQTKACGYMGIFTDNRPALLVAPDGGHLVQTPVYDEKVNIVSKNIKISFNTEGGAQLDATNIYSGTMQEPLWNDVERGQDRLKKNIYESLKINDFEIKKLDYKKHAARIPSISETMQLDIRQLGSVSGKRQFVPINLLSVWSDIPPSDSTRHSEVQADSRGFTMTDSVNIELPTGVKAESLPEPLSITTVFGDYNLSAKTIDKNKILIIRQLILNAKIFPSTKYTDLVAFFKQISKADKSKIVLLKE